MISMNQASARLMSESFYLFCIMLFLSICVFPQQTDDEVIRVDSSIVVVNAVVTDKSGRPINGLKRNDFELYVDGNLQDITSFSTEETPFAAVILIDASGSMEERIRIARAAAIRFLQGIRDEDVVAICSFDSKVNLLQDFSNSRDIEEAIFDLKADGMTVLNDAIFRASAMLAERPEKRRAIIILSDGADTFSKISADKALSAALGVNAIIYTVDMSSPQANPRERMESQAALRRFAERSGGRFITTPGGFALQQAFKEIVSELGNQYTIVFHPSESKDEGGWHSIEVRVKREGAKVRAREGYISPVKNSRKSSR